MCNWKAIAFVYGGLLPMGKERYHSPGKVNKQHNAVMNKVRFTYLQGEFDLFFVVFNAINIGCRDPPYQFVF